MKLTKSGRDGREQILYLARPGQVQADSAVTAGRYLVIIGGCNDCHTAGYMAQEGNVPESDWLTGSPVGWRGPWGTTYPSNLRLLVQSMSEDAWVEMLHRITSYNVCYTKLLRSLPHTDFSDLGVEHLVVEPQQIAYLPTTSTPEPAAISDAMGKVV